MTRKSLGDLYEATPITVGETIDGTLARIKAMRKTSKKTTTYNERCAKFWQHRGARTARVMDQIVLPSRQPFSRAARRRRMWGAS